MQNSHEQREGEIIMNYKNKILRPAWLEIDLEAIASNVQNIKKYLGSIRYCAVVKANAYGTGVLRVINTILANGADMLGVVMLDEAVEIRKAGINAPIINLGPILPDQVECVFDLDIEQMVYRQQVALALSEYGSKHNKIVKIHLKIDTGMSRYGIHYSEAFDIIEQIRQLSNVVIVGAFSHLAMSDAVDKSFALLQIERLKNLKHQCENNDIYIPIWHMANSGGTLDLPDAWFNMVRVGLMNYGYWPSDDVKQPFFLKPSMSLKAKVIAVREIRRGDSVGYGRKYMAEKDELIAILPIGYSDGYNRRLSKIGQVLWQGHRVPIIGGICMDALFLNATEFPDIKIGDTVTLMGLDGNEEISPHEIARLSNTVSYDVISTFSRRLPKLYKENKKVFIDNELTRD